MDLPAADALAQPVGLGLGRDLGGRREALLRGGAGRPGGLRVLVGFGLLRGAAATLRGGIVRPRPRPAGGGGAAVALSMCSRSDDTTSPASLSSSSSDSDAASDPHEPSSPLSPSSPVVSPSSASGGVASPTERRRPRRGVWLGA